MTPPTLRCTVCGIEVILSEDAAVMVAEVETFCAAHDAHDGGYEVDADVSLDDDQTA